MSFKLAESNFEYKDLRIARNAQVDERRPGLGFRYKSRPSRLLRTNNILCLDYS